MPLVMLTPYNVDVPFIKTLGDTFGSDIANNVVVAPSGNFYICGKLGIFTPNDQGFIAKYDPSLNLVWQRTLGITPFFNAFYEAVVDVSENVYVFGEGVDMMHAKYDTNGSIVWQKEATGNSARSFGGTIDSSGDIYSAGTAAPVFGSDGLVGKFNSNGNKIWETLFHSAASQDYIYGVDTDGTDIYPVGGRIGHMTVARLDSAGAIVWQRRLNGSTTDEGQDIHVDSSGNVYAVGYTNSTEAGTPLGTNALVLAKWSQSGVTPTYQWQRTLTGTGNDLGIDVTTDTSGNVYVVGTTDSDGAGGTDILIAKFTSAGALVWQRTLGTGGNSTGTSIQIDAAGRMVITGSSGTDMIVARLPVDGTKTGTYGSHVYQASTLTMNVSTIPESAGILTVTTGFPAIPNNPGTATDAAGGATETIIA